MPDIKSSIRNEIARLQIQLDALDKYGDDVYDTGTILALEYKHINEAGEPSPRFAYAAYTKINGTKWASTLHQYQESFEGIVSFLTNPDYVFTNIRIIMPKDGKQFP